MAVTPENRNRMAVEIAAQLFANNWSPTAANSFADRSDELKKLTAQCVEDANRFLGEAERLFRQGGLSW
jgi:hypothetical protein